MERKIDFLFLTYFVLHIPIYIFVDSQAVMPRWIYPQKVLDITDWYVTYFRDSMMADPPAWFQSFVLCESILQLPFFFVAAYAFWTGVSKCKWVRLPAIVYSSHVITVLIAILYYVQVEDFSQSKAPGPATLSERFTLSAFYFPFLAVPFALLLDALFSSVYREHVKES